MASLTSTTSSLPHEIREQLDVSLPDYFLFFGLPEQLGIDVDALQTLFYERSRQLHPDRFVRGSAADRSDSLKASSILNDGYRILKDPLRRAEYLLTRHGFDIGEQRSNNVPPELLEEVFELNMALDELRSGDDEARPQLEEARQRFLSLREECDTSLNEHFAAWDSQHLRDTLAQIRAILNRRRYIQNLVRDVEAALSPAGA